jgi:hypothetical protein
MISSGQFSEQAEAESNLILMISNQSSEVPEVRMTVTFDGNVIVDKEFDAAGQSQYTYYYGDVYATGKHKLEVSANGESIKEVVTITADEPLWASFSYRNGANEEGGISVVLQNERI